MAETKELGSGKVRDLVDGLSDSTRWNGFPFRAGDVVTATYAKVGTTWTQQIVSQLINGGAPGVFDMTQCPWVDFRVMPFAEMMARIEAQTCRRNLKTHLPADTLELSPLTKYLVVGRDARDMVWSAYNHQAGYTDEALARFNSPPGRPGPPVSRPDRPVRDYYLHFVETGELPGFGFVPFWPFVQGWWDLRGRRNVLFLHFDRLKQDLAGEMRRIAAFLDIAVDDALWPTLVEHCEFDYMRRVASDDPTFGRSWREGGKTFFHKGESGRWKDTLTAGESALCDQAAARNLTPDCARWLRTGETPT